MKYNDQPGYGSLKPLNRLQQKKYGEIIVNKTKPGLRSASSINNRKISGSWMRRKLRYFIKLFNIVILDY